MKTRRLPPPPKSNKQVQEYVEAVERGRNSFSVTAKGQGWRVKQVSDRQGSGQFFATKSEAMRAATERAAEYDSRVVVL